MIKDLQNERRKVSSMSRAGQAYNDQWDGWTDMIEDLRNEWHKVSSMGQNKNKRIGYAYNDQVRWMKSKCKRTYQEKGSWNDVSECTPS